MYKFIYDKFFSLENQSKKLYAILAKCFITTLNLNYLTNSSETVSVVIDS
jgi:hypothetical protein